MKTTNEVIREYMDRSEEVEDMERLICNIKTTCESRYYTEEFKIKWVLKEIREGGF